MKHLENIQSSEKAIIVKVRGMFEYQVSCDAEKGFIVWEEDKGFTTRTHGLAFTKPRTSVVGTDEMIECIDSFEKNFQDLQNRQLIYSKLRSILTDARDNTDVRNESILLFLNMVLDALKNMKSEDLTIEKVETIRSVITELNESLTKSRVRTLQKKLFEAGFKPVPKLDGISELYKL